MRDFDLLVRVLCVAVLAALGGGWVARMQDRAPVEVGEPSCRPAAWSGVRAVARLEEGNP